MNILNSIGCICICCGCVCGDCLCCLYLCCGCVRGGCLFCRCLCCGCLFCGCLCCGRLCSGLHCCSCSYCDCFCCGLFCGCLCCGHLCFGRLCLCFHHQPHPQHHHMPILIKKILWLGHLPRGGGKGEQTDWQTHKHRDSLCQKLICMPLKLLGVGLKVTYQRISFNKVNFKILNNLESSWEMPPAQY